MKDPETLASFPSPEKSILQKLETQGKFRGAVFTDIDHTFHLIGKEQASRDVVEYCNASDLPIIAVTGNACEAILARIDSGELPLFDVIVGSAGTQMWRLENQDGVWSYAPDTEFDAHVQNLEYDRLEITQKADNLMQTSMGAEMQLQFQRPELEQAFLQGTTEAEQPYKTGMYFFAESATAASIPEFLALVAKTFPGQQVVWCEEINFSKHRSENDPYKFCLDVLPITKAGAINYLVDKHQIQHGIFSGDSGNDPILEVAPQLMSVVVGGSKAELKNTADTAPKAYIGPQQEPIRSVIGPDRKLHTVYFENSDLQGPESMLEALQLLEKNRQNASR